MFENIRLAFLGLRTNKMRSALTMLGITIGVAAVIILISLGQAVESYIVGQFSDIGTNLIFVFGTLDERGIPQPLTMSDYHAVSDVYRVPDALYSVPSLMTADDMSSEIVFEDRQTSASVIGTTPQYFSVINRRAEIGRTFTPDEETGAARVAVVGADVVEKLFESVNPLGQDIRIEGVRFQIIGVLARMGGASGFGPGGGPDNQILVPLSTAQARLQGTQTVGGEQPVTQIVLQARDESSIPAVVEQVRQTLREEHDISFQGEDDFEVATQEDLLASLGAVTGILTIFLGVIAGISLLVGGIGIMNIMLVTVTERTREIGLRKAVGAQRGAILLQFLTEATVLALAGGGAGMAIAWGMAALVSSAVPDLAVQIQPSSVALATIISVLIGIFFGIYPANRAAALNPIDALRYE